jgi:seryl-tRNA synthetase
VAVLENYQNEDGSIDGAGVLRPTWAALASISGPEDSAA